MKLFVLNESKEQYRYGGPVKRLTKRVEGDCFV